MTTTVSKTLVREREPLTHSPHEVDRGNAFRQARERQADHAWVRLERHDVGDRSAQVPERVARPGPQVEHPSTGSSKNGSTPRPQLAPLGPSAEDCVEAGEQRAAVARSPPERPQPSVNGGATHPPPDGEDASVRSASPRSHDRCSLAQPASSTACHRDGGRPADPQAPAAGSVHGGRATGAATTRRWPWLPRAGTWQGPVEPAGQPSVAVAQQLHGRGDNQHPDDGGVDQNAALGASVQDARLRHDRGAHEFGRRELVRRTGRAQPPAGYRAWAG